MTFTLMLPPSIKLVSTPRTLLAVALFTGVSASNAQMIEVMKMDDARYYLVGPLRGWLPRGLCVCGLSRGHQNCDAGVFCRLLSRYLRARRYPIGEQTGHRPPPARFPADV